MAWHLDPVDEPVVPAECAKHAEGDGNASDGTAFL
jgi:hypothetical protein